MRSPLRIPIFVFFVLFSGHYAMAQRGGLGWAWQNPLPQGNSLYSIHFAPDKETGFAVGSDGTILRTLDGGFTWARQFSPEDATMSSVFVLDKDNAFVVGSRGTVLTTANGGKDWRRVAMDTRDHLYSVKFAGGGRKTGWITGTYGRI